MHAPYASWMALIAWPALAGCESVPDLHFADADGSVGDAQAEAASSDSASEADAEGGTSCTGTSPGGSNFCCGTTWCGGACGQTDCAGCLTLCGAGKVCCVKNGNTICRVAGQLCPP